MNTVDAITGSLLDAVEIELKRAVEHSDSFRDSRLYEMLAYHMGWTDDAQQAILRGKRIRPLLVLLVCSAAGGDWTLALPGATAVELIHNFSLIHDDIEDNSPLRRGRPTVWKKWGIPQAINTGDAMFALAHLEAVRLSNSINPEVGLKAVELLQQTCLHLTQGQFLDLSYETRSDLTIEDYWPMVEGKTAALISASTQIGALAALSDDNKTNFYKKFGYLLGLAFQVQDDYLGIWGNQALTGKSTQSDLITGKITLPVIYGLVNAGEFARRWSAGPICSDDLPRVIDLLVTEGAEKFVRDQTDRFLTEALSALNQASPQGIAGEALRDLTISIVNRQA
jgi:geranylgeranyl diphosphate synthase type I